MKKEPLHKQQALLKCSHCFVLLEESHSENKPCYVLVKDSSPQEETGLKGGGIKIKDSSLLSKKHFSCSCKDAFEGYGYG